MASSLVFSLTPPNRWEAYCKRKGSLFNTCEWQHVLHRGFHCLSLYAWDEKSETGFIINIFKAGPFRLGYAKFPVSDLSEIEVFDTDCLFSSNFQKSLSPKTLDSINFTYQGSSFAKKSGLQYSTILETSIYDLQTWQPEKQKKKVRYTINQLRNSQLLIRDAEEELHAKAMYDIYHDTILRNDGNLRYTSEYFTALVNLAKQSKQLRCLLAYKDEEIAGFHVVACDEGTAYHLHGGIRTEYKHYSPSDLLFFTSIMWSKSMAMNKFNMLASPESQKTLIRYKEKWGGITEEKQIYTLAMNKNRIFAFNALKKIYERYTYFVRKLL